MKAALPGLGLLAALIIVPFALRPVELVDDPDATKLSILTPHNEAIRYEVTRGFKRYLREHGGRKVRLDWRSPGGTTEISRYLASEYRSRFEAYWQSREGRALSEAGARAFANPRQTSEGTDEPARARRAFLTSKVGVNVDVLFGGGSYDFSQHAAAGRLVDAGLLERHPELFGDHGIPQTVGGEPYWDRQGRWYRGWGWGGGPGGHSRRAAPGARVLESAGSVLRACRRVGRSWQTRGSPGTSRWPTQARAARPTRRSR